MKVTNKKLKKMVAEIIHQMYYTGTYPFKPSYVVGISPNGIQAALMISEYFGVPMYALHVDEKNPDMSETNCWMAEDAFGYVPENHRQTEKSRWDVTRRKNILIIDGLNGSGETVEWIKKDWQSSCFPSEQYAWDSIWNHTVKFAVLVNDESSSFKDIDYSAKIVRDENVEFPWNNWWK